MSVHTPSTSGGKAFPTSIDKSEEARYNHAEPNLLSRSDLPHGRWTVNDCSATRGEPRTNIDKRVMFAPASSDETDRVMRAHEMLHAKLSPNAEQMEKWVERGIASPTALIVTEELRINYLAQKAGFDVKNLLADGGEMSVGENLAKNGEWEQAVAMCFATAGTAGHKKFLTGIRRHNRAWGDALLDIGKRAMREMKKADRNGSIASTEERYGVAPYGFIETERIAEWVDRIASFPPPKDRKGDSGKSKGKSKAESESTSIDKSEDERESPDGKTDYSELEEGEKSGNPIKDSKPTETSRYGATPRWGELRVSREPMPRLHVGNIGKRKVATNMGRRPRRLHRYMTDPAKRVFDKTIRGAGGMVIIDASGSMSFTTQQIIEIVDNAKGATVALYSDRGSSGGTNFWVVADKGRMVENVEYIDYGYGNGVDYPAIVWGVQNRQNPKAPLVWVTDGGVSGAGDSFQDILTMQCIDYARKHGYIVVPHIEEAINQLSKLRVGGTARSVYPYNFKEVYRSVNGVELAD
jgi:hypothetical protein